MTNHPKDNQKRGITRGDICLILVLAVISAGFLVFQKNMKSGSMVRIYSDNELVNEIPLKQDQTVEINTDLGTNTIVVENNHVYVKEADCPDKRCVLQGRISHPGETIICLPHKLIVEVSDED